MEKYYTSEKHTQILIALMKFHRIKKIVVSPGATNICLVGSLQSDPYFEMYSCIDERSAAYMACGLAVESGEPVALSCTGSTASRNYVPGLTEAYYRKLPVLAITSTQHPGRVGNMYPQVVDRSRQMNDLVAESVQIDCVYTQEDEWACGVLINKAIIALKKGGGGPAHINLVTTYSRDFSVRVLPRVKGIDYISRLADMPSLDHYSRIAILTGVHEKWQESLLASVDKFCELYNAVVLMNHASNYKGKYGVNHALILNMKQYESTNTNADLVIYIGSVPRYMSGMKNPGCEMWRVNPDGEMRDPEKMLTKVFAMEEVDFFEYYIRAKKSEICGSEYAELWQREYEEIIAKIPELPFSNVWLAQNTIGKLPDKSVLHIAGSNTARAWNFFKLPRTIECYSNDGAMGIDGQVSALIGESLACQDRLHFGVAGDLTFFYDMNSIGNRHIKNNLRLMIINNGVGAEFRIYSHPAYAFHEEGKYYMAGEGHYGKKSPALIRHYAEDLGFEYLCASTKEEFLQKLERFLTPELTKKPLIFEIFTDSEDENRAVYIMNHIAQNSKGTAIDLAKNMVKAVAGDKGIDVIKKYVKR